MIEALLNRIDRHRRLVWAVLLCAVAASAYNVTRLAILDSPERWMPQSTVEEWKVFDNHFDVGDTVGVGLHFIRPVREDDLPRLARLRSKFERVAGMKQVYDASLVAEKVEAVPLLTLLDPANHERFSLYAGALWDMPQAERKDRTLVTVCELEFFPAEESADKLNDRRRSVVTDVERIVAEEQSAADWGEGVEFHVASSIVMMHELERRARQVGFTFLPVSIAVGMVSLYFSFRSWRTLIVAMLSAGLAILLVMGWIAAPDPSALAGSWLTGWIPIVMGWLGGGTGVLGVVTVATPALVTLIVVASTMHFAAYSAEHGTTGEGNQRPILVSWVAVPCLGAAVTTAVGFLMLRFNDLAPVRELGTQLFVGSLLAFFAVFVVTQWVPIRKASSGAILTHARLRAYAKFVIRWPRATSLMLLAVSAALVYGAWPRPADQSIGLYVDADPFSFFAADQPIAKALKHFSDRKFGVYQLDVVLVPEDYAPKPKVGQPRNETYEANRRAARQFSDKILASNLGVVRVVSTEAFRDREQKFSADLARIRREEGLLAAGMKLARIAGQSKTFSQTFQSWNVDKQNEGALRLTFLAHDQGADGFAPLVEFARENLPEDRFQCHLCGSITQIVHLGEALSGGMIRGLSLSVLIIAVLCGAMFRSPLYTLLALPPNLFPVLVVYGMMGWFKIPISSGSAMVATIALGIAVNDTMHFILHYQRLTREKGLPVSRAVVDTIDDLGRPIVLTSVVHIAGFTVFLLTDFQPLYHFGLLSSAAMVAAMAGDLLMLPNLLLLLDRVNAGKPGPPPTTVSHIAPPPHVVEPPHVSLVQPLPASEGM